MKVLSNQNLEALQGGIRCRDIPVIMSYLLEHNPAQYHYNLVTYAEFGHGGTISLQCDEE